MLPDCLSRQTVRSAHSFASPRILLLFPAGAYALSYLYLALYHRRLLLFYTIVHEGGTLTFVEVFLYTSHFLGHVPVHTVLAFFFVAGYLWFCGDGGGARSRWSPVLWGVVLAGFLTACTAGSLLWFGLEETLDFVRQRKQTIHLQVEGGSWNLHLPSTLLVPWMLPAFFRGARHLWGGEERDPRAFPLFVAGSVLLLLFTVLFNSDPVGAVLLAVADPRYLGHSVREVATFSVTYFPPALYLFLAGRGVRGRRKGASQPRQGEGLWIWLTLCFATGLSYQAGMTLQAGVSELAQKPSFASGGRLSIPYLLASHYWEHFLDTIYFCLFSGLLLQLIRHFRGKSQKGSRRG